MQEDFVNSILQKNFAFAIGNLQLHFLPISLLIYFGNQNKHIKINAIKCRRDLKP